jgi:hypothetical protein
LGQVAKIEFSQDDRWPTDIVDIASTIEPAATVISAA